MKNFLISLVAVIVFIVSISILVVGVGSKGNNNEKNSNDVEKYSIKANDIVFNNQSGGGPKIKVFITKEKKIVEMYLEEYVRGVVAGEMPAEFQVEALKAQAVVARTYAFSHMETFGGEKCGQAKGADICDSVHCQVYLGKDEVINSWGKSKSSEYWNKITDAVTSTLGQVLTYNGKLVLYPLYFSTSSGRTEDAKDVFNIDEPYLKSVQSKGEEVSSKYKTSLKISYSTLASKLNRAYSKAGLNSSKIKNQIKILGNTPGGSVKNIKVGNITITGVDFRTTLGLDSANFTLKFNDENVEILCRGYGHDVGMSQWGANSMARNGSKFSDILMHYYIGVKVEKMKY